MSETGTKQPRRLEPTQSELTEPFWEATRRQELLLQWCRTCEQPIFYPREACPRCLGDELEWRPASGRGEVYAVSVQHLSPMPLPAYSDGPYAVAIIELPEGVRMMSNVVGCPAEDVVVGMPVAVGWEPLTDGRNLPIFQPSAS